MSKHQFQERFYYFLRSREKCKRDFSMDDILTATGWKPATFKSYLAKGQLAQFVSIGEKGRYEASNTLDISFKEFEKALSQSKHVQSLGHNCRSKLAKALLKKSKDNMLLAIELYNRPSLENKLDGFVMLFCTAWDQLLKAKLIEADGEESIYKKSGKGLRQTISLRDACERCYKKDSKVKQNILRITALRDEAVHLLVPEVQGLASRIFQSGVFNYSSAFEEFCEVPFIKTTNLGMLSLVGSFQMPPLAMMRTVYGTAADEMLELANELTTSIEKSNDVAFAIPLNVTLQFATNDEEGAQIILAKADEGVPGLQKALTIVKSVDAEKTHPYRQSDLLREINARLNILVTTEKLTKILVARKDGKPIFNGNCFQAVVQKLKWKHDNNRFHHYLEKANTHLYSEQAVNEIIDKLMSIKDYLLKCKKDYGQLQRAKRG